jgi:glycosyltransferase involved in cell wall biosynthesis
VSVALSVVIAARDEEEQLSAALASVAGWAEDLVVVVDPRTADRTREVAREAGARVLEHEFESSGAQSNWGISQCRNDWALVLDADERVTRALRDAIGAAIAAPAHAAYRVRRRNLAFGRRLRFGDWGRDEIVRVLDRRRARFDERAVHGAVAAPSIGRLAGDLEHHTLRSLPQYLPKVHDYALRGARDLVAAGRTSSVPGAAVHALWRFLRSYLFRLGFLDGSPGLVAAALAAYGTFLKRVAVWEAATSRRPRP